MTVSARLRVPVARRSLLERPRLANPLVAEPFPRLVLLSAAAGSGKTTLLQQWLGQVLGGAGRAGCPGARVAWVSLNESDADSGQFLCDLVAAVGAVDGDLAARALAMLADGRAQTEDVLVGLVEDLDNAPGRTVIALDDLHLMASGPAAAGAVAFLVDNLPPRVVVAATSRTDPALPLARLRARGELVEVRDADLRFNDGEAAAFLREALGLDLQPDQIQALASRTEGWAAGLQLAAMSARAHVAEGPGAIDAFIRAFSGTHRFVFDYLVEEVLDAQPVETRAFLLSTSVLDRLSGSLCDALTGGSDGGRQLDRLERSNVFLTALDDGGWYRYHALFAEAVRGRLAVVRPDAVASLHRRASGWYAMQGMLEDALRHAAQAEDPGWFADLLECAAPVFRQERRDRLLIEWLDGLPDVMVRQRPLLATTRAAAGISQGHLAAAAQWLDAAEAAWGGIDSAPDDADLPVTVLAARNDAQRTVPANIELFRASLAQASGDVAATVRHAEAALGVAGPADHFVRGAAAGFVGLAHWARGELGPGIETFGGVVDHLAAAGNHTDASGASVVIGEMTLANGKPAAAERLYRVALARAAAGASGGEAVLGDLHVGLADVLREGDRLEEAAEQLNQAAVLGESASLPENRFRWFAVRAGLQVAVGQFDAALADIAESEQRRRPGFLPDTRPLHAARARVLIRSGRLSEARAWVGEQAVAGTDPADFAREHEVLTYARLVAAERRAGRSSGPEVERVLTLTEQVVSAAERADRAGSWIEGLTVRSLVLAAVGAPAVEPLAAAVTAGVAAGYARLFLDEGAPLRELLARLAASGGPAADAARRLLHAEPRAAGLALPLEKGGTLSEREAEVLRLLATDLSGPEIAARLFVSINTLRTHTKHIFSKLDVRTRRAAVSRARERGLLRERSDHPGGHIIV